MADLLGGLDSGSRGAEAISEGAVLLRGFAAAQAAALVSAVHEIAAAAPFRRMVTPGGFTMSATISNCGAVGWVSDRKGYRYAPADPQSGRPWPVMPAIFSDLANLAAAACGFAGFTPDACLINRYEPGARMSLHQDRDERDFSQPIVSVSLGLPIRFLFGGAARGDRATRVTLESGDVVVFGGAARRHFHGVAPLAGGVHPLTGGFRYNLTFRKAL